MVSLQAHHPTSHLELLAIYFHRSTEPLQLPCIKSVLCLVSAVLYWKTSIIHRCAGTFIGPVVGGFMAQMSSSEWLFILLAGWSYLCSHNTVSFWKAVLALWGALTILGGVLLRETYSPVLRMRQAKQENDLDKAARVHPMLLDSHTHILTLFRINITRPLELLFHNFICFILCLFEAM